MRPLIIGVSGQDGANLAGLLLDRGYEVICTLRHAQVGCFENLRRLQVLQQVKLDTMGPVGFPQRNPGASQMDAAEDLQPFRPEPQWGSPSSSRWRPSTAS